MEMKEIIAHGPVIIKAGKLLVSKDGKDDFYKIPGGRPEGDETPIQTLIREVMEETGLECEILEELSTMILNRNPTTGEEMRIELHHYLARLTTKVDLKDFKHDGYEIRWLDIEEIKQGKYDVSPNIKFLIERGEIK